MAITFINGVTIGANLGTFSNPAISAVQLYNAGVRTNGWYWIKTGMMTSSVQVYCNQIDNGGLVLNGHEHNFFNVEIDIVIRLF